MTGSWFVDVVLCWEIVHADRVRADCWYCWSIMRASVFGVFGHVDDAMTLAFFVA